MWKVKVFQESDIGKAKSLKDQWVNKNENKYQMVELFVNNGYAIQYRPLKHL